MVLIIKKKILGKKKKKNYSPQQPHKSESWANKHTSLLPPATPLQCSLLAKPNREPEGLGRPLMQSAQVSLPGWAGYAA